MPEKMMRGKIELERAQVIKKKLFWFYLDPKKIVNGWYLPQNLRNILIKLTGYNKMKVSKCSQVSKNQITVG